MKLASKIRTSVALMAMIAIPANIRAAVIVYQANGGFTASGGGVVFDTGNNPGQGNAPNVSVNFSYGTLMDTVYFDSANLTVRQVISATGPQAMGTFSESHTVNGNSVQGSLTLTQGAAQLILDTGNLPIVYNSGSQTYQYPNSGLWPEIGSINVNGSYSLTTGGQTYANTFSYNLGVLANSGASFPYPTAFTTFAPNDNNSSLSLGGAQGYHYFLQGGSFASVTAADGFQMDLVSGQSDDHLQDFDWSGGSATAFQVATPEPGTYALMGMGFVALIWARKKRGRGTS